MKVNYQYASPSMCVQQEGHTTLGLSPDISRDEKVSFLGKLKNPLVFRDAMLMLREIVVSDANKKQKERKEFFEWLNEEIERRMQEHEKYLPGVREELKNNIDDVLKELDEKEKEIGNLISVKNKLQNQINSYDAWNDYNLLEKKFWQFIRNRDSDLWFVLDPVITVHPDQVSFEAFSVDESIYGCLSIEMDEFELLKPPSLGTTNIDFSSKLAKEMERFRTYTDVELSVNPEGFTIDTGVTPEHMEKKIDLPETWIKGFNQVSSAANLNGITLELSTIDMYDICSFLRRHKEKKSPRYMKWILEKNKPVRIVFEPFGTELILKSVYTGDKNREEKIWGRRRWLVIEKLIPLAKSFQIKLFGFGMPQFIIADLGKMKMTIGFSSWSANDWVKGTAFNIMSGFIGEGKYTQVYSLLKEKRCMSVEDICNELDKKEKNNIIAGIGSLFKHGEGYFDAVNNKVRFRKLCNESLPEELYKTTRMEYQVKALIDSGMEHFTVKLTENNEYIFTNFYQTPNEKYQNYYYRGTEDYNRKYDLLKTEIVIDEDGQICKLNCDCREFKKGSRNISAPCAHILALYVVSTKFTRLKLEYNKEYKINDIMEMLL